MVASLSRNEALKRRSGVYLLGPMLAACVSCSHLDPYASPGNSRPSDVSLMLANSSHEAPAPRANHAHYVGSLYGEMQRADLHRARLNSIISQIGNERDIYDAALWLVAVPLLVADPAPKNLVRGGALMAGWYSLLNMRPKEAVPRMQAGVGELTCLMREFSPYLYTTSSYGTTDSSEPHPAIQELAEAITAYRREAREFSRQIKVTGPSVSPKVTCDADGSEECAARKRVLQKTTPGNGARPVAFAVAAESRASQADKVLAAFERWDAYIRTGAALDFSARTQLVLGAMGRDLEERRPAMQELQQALASPRAGAVAQGGERVTTATGARYEELLLLKLKNSKAAQEFDEVDIDLSAKLDTAKRFLTDLRARQDSANHFLRTRCHALPVPAPSSPAAPPASPNASDPASFELPLEPRP